MPARGGEHNPSVGPKHAQCWNRAICIFDDMAPAFRKVKLDR